jgi:hypothetical protein
LTEANFGSWKKATVPAPVYPVASAPAKTYVAIVDKPSAVQSVINLVTPFQLQPGQPDVIPSSVMNTLLGNGSSGRLYKNLREKYGFTYGAYSSINPDKLVANFTADASVRNEKTDSAIGQFLVELNRIREENVNADEINQTKNEMSGSFARSLESPETIARFALNVARYNLPKDYYQNYLQKLASVDNLQVKAMADKYVLPANLHIVVVGNAKQITKGLEKYGEIRYFDVYGNEKQAPVEKKVDPSVSAESIFKKSIDAQGGESAINAVKDLTMTGTASVMGQVIDYSSVFIFPSGFLNTMSMRGMSLSKQSVKNDQYSVIQQGAEQSLKDGDKEELDETASLFIESYLLKKAGYSFTVKGIESVEGKDAYNIEIKSPKERVFNFYYDLASGLRVKEVRTEDNAGVKSTVIITNTGYKEVNGVKLPVKQLFDTGPLKINIEIKDIKCNQGLKLDDLK